MVESIMYFGIGFLVAALFGLLFVPLVHSRAVRLTMRRMEAATPLSMSEIRADKDQLRAEFAMSTRRLEMSVEQMKTRTTTQLVELGKKADTISQLKKELSEKTATVAELEARDQTLREQLRITEQEFARRSDVLQETEHALADKEAELAKSLSELGERSVAADSQRIELASLRTQIEAMKVGVGDYERAVKETEERLGRERGSAAASARQLEDARGKLDGFAVRTTELERQLVVQTTEAELLNRRLQELEMRLGDQDRRLAEREAEIVGLRREVEGGRNTESDLRAEIASSGRAAADRFRSRISELEGELAAAMDERAKLLRDIAAMEREAEAAWAAERVENAMLRERINDVAAEVARLTAVLEGPDSPIEAMLALDAPALGQDTSEGIGYAASGVNGAATGRAAETPIDAPRQGKGTLADRIRALQSAASRVATN